MNKLMRSTKDRVFLGVCGGIGNYFNVDSTIIRLIFVILGFINFGMALIGYIIAGFVMPEGDSVIYDDDYEENYEYKERNAKLRKNTPIFIGLGLILWGVYLLTELIIPNLFFELRHLWNYWPVLLILLGLYVLFQKRD